jgi:shikimate kinase
MALCEKILIAGFSGAGKTSLIHELSSTRVGPWEAFDDLDKIIFKNRGKKHKDLAHLIEDVGWETFRKWERQEFESWLKDEGHGILALGGGTLSPLLWELYSKSRKIKFCFLNVPYEVCWERMKKQGLESRPMASLGDEKLKDVYQTRMKLFSQISWKIDGTLPPDKLAQIFWEELRSSTL